jgi:hypothetical protein
MAVEVWNLRQALYSSSPPGRLLAAISFLQAGRYSCSRKSPSCLKPLLTPS